MIALLAVLLQQNFPTAPQFPIPTDAELQSALQVYRQYGLPLPPRGSQLVKYPSGESMDQEGNRTTHWAIAYKLPGRELMLLRGLGYLPDESSPISWAKPEEAQAISGDEAKTLKGSAYGGFDVKFEINNSLAMAIQFYYLGDLDLAQHFASGEYFRYYGKDKSVVGRTYLLVGKYYLSQYADKGADVSRIVRALTQVRENLDSGYGWNWIQQQADAVIAAQQQFTSRPGSDERLVDELIYYGLHEDERRYFDRFNDPYFKAILARGVAIVPTLIKHLEDNRATRNFSRGQMNGVDNFSLINALCERIVGSLMSSRQVNRGSILRTQNPIEWWDSVKGKSEIEILERAIFFHEEDAIYDRDKAGSVSLNAIPLEIFKLRYPSKLPDLYLESLDRAGNTNEALASIIDESSLSDEKKADLFRTAIDRGTASHKATAARYLKEYDSEAAKEALRSALQLESPFGDSPGISADYQAAGFAGQVMENGDLEMAETLVEKALKEDSGVRVNVILGIYGRWGPRKETELQVPALRLFLNDSTVHTTHMQRLTSGDRSAYYIMRSEPFDLLKFDNPVQVRDYAAWCIGRLIGVQREPQEGWRAEDWDQYHEIVLDALRKRDGLLLSLSS